MNTSPDLHALTGAYALGALPEDERESFEQHLRECSVCAEEVAEFTEVATKLASAGAGQPPEQLRDRVLAEVSNTRQVPPEVTQDTGTVAKRGIGRAHSRWWRRAGVVAAAAAAVAAIVFGYEAVVANQQLDELRMADDSYTALTELLSSGDVRVVTGSTEAGVNTTAVVSYNRGTAMVMTRGLAPVPSDKVYQAWIMDGHQPRPVGLLRDSGQPYTGIVVHNVDEGDKFGLTVEPAGGSPQPTSSPVVGILL